VTPPKRTRSLLPVLIVLFFAAAGAAAVYFYTRPAPQAVVSTSTEYDTAPVQSAELTMNATGTASVVAARSADAGFSTSGTIAEVLVDLGAQVEAGQVLARLDNLAELDLAVENAELALQTAEKDLADLKSGGAAAIAQGLADQASAQAAVAEAEKNLRDAHVSRCDDDTIARYYQAYLDAVAGARPWQDLLKQAQANGQDLQYYQENLQPFLDKLYRADINYQYCLAYTPAEIQASQAALDLARAEAEKAAQEYADLAVNGGVDPVDLAVAEAAVGSARLSLAHAQETLAGATLVAPISGVVTALHGQAGEAAPGGVFITIADLTNPELQVTMDEVDLQSFAVGCKADITFSGISGQYTGLVSEVYPQLSSSMDSSSVQGIVTLDDPAALGRLPLGLAASVDITCSEGGDALTVPLQAIRQSGRTDTYYVYVLNEQAEPEMRTVELGIQTANLIEIKSGLNAGEAVITNPNGLP
jgi:HlyD family secretion protein